jgi:adenylylsulfate kinase-like enzyme
MIIWLTGQPCSGKTTIAQELLKTQEFKDAFLIDGDRIRELFNNKDYSEKGRRDNVQLAQNLAFFINNNHKDVIVAMVSPYKDQREEFKQKIGNSIKEIYIHTSEIRGRENFHVNNYEVPLSDFIDIDTTGKTPLESAELIIKQL